MRDYTEPRLRAAARDGTQRALRPQSQFFFAFFAIFALIVDVADN